MPVMWECVAHAPDQGRAFGVLSLRRKTSTQAPRFGPPRHTLAALILDDGLHPHSVISTHQARSFFASAGVSGLSFTSCS